MKRIKVKPNFFALYFLGKGLRSIPKNLYKESHIVDQNVSLESLYNTRSGFGLNIEGIGTNLKARVYIIGCL